MRKRLKRVKARVVKFRTDRRAQAGGAASEAANVIVGLLVASLVAAFLLPIAINEIVSVSTSGWTSGAGELWALLPVMMVLAVFLYFVGLALSSGDL